MTTKAQIIKFLEPFDDNIEVHINMRYIISDDGEGKIVNEVIKPIKCPVCDGRGQVPANFYDFNFSSTSASPEKCKSCDGRGVLWNF